MDALEGRDCSSCRDRGTSVACCLSTRMFAVEAWLHQYAILQLLDGYSVLTSTEVEVTRSAHSDRAELSSRLTLQFDPNLQAVD